MGREFSDCSNITATMDRGLEPNPDISGIGVLIGFLATAWASFIIMIFYYVVAPQESDNLLDISICKNAQKIFTALPSLAWASTAETVVLAMSDQLLVTGLAFIISGYYQTQHGLSVYHWQIIIRLVWFASVTHIATLLCLEEYFQRHRYIWYARVVLMTGLTIMLVVGIFVEGNAHYSDPVSDNLAAPAVCSFGIGTYYFDWSEGWATLVSEALLIGGLIIRIVQMFSMTRKLCSSLFQMLAKRWRAALAWYCGKSSYYCLQTISLTLVTFGLVVSVTMQSLLEFIRSRMFGLLWLLLSLIWGNIRILSLRDLGRRRSEFHIPSNSENGDGNIFEEDTWSFGQLVPVLMLLVPLLLVAEGCSDIANKNNMEFRMNGLPSQIRTPADNISAILQNQTDQTSGDVVLNAPLQLLQSSANPLSTRISCLCHGHFQSELWYRDSMLFAAATMIGTACTIFTLNEELARDTSFLIYMVITFLACVACLALFPLCGILDKLEPEKQLAMRDPLSVVRLAADSGKEYRVLRFIYFLGCPMFAILYVAILSSKAKFAVIPSIPMYCWCFFTLILIIIASLMTVISIRRQLNSEKG